MTMSSTLRVWSTDSSGTGVNTIEDSSLGERALEARLAVKIIVTEIGNHLDSTASADSVVSIALIARITEATGLVLVSTTVGILATVLVQARVGTLSSVGVLETARIKGTVSIMFAFIRIEAHMERIADPSTSAGALSTMIAAGTASILATQELLTRVLTDVYLVSALHTDSGSWTVTVGEAFVNDRPATGDKVVRSAG